MIRTSWGARAFVRNHQVPQAAWAARIGITKANLCLMLNGNSRFQHGPAMKRLIQLLDALDKGEWRWERTGTRFKANSYRVIGQAEFEKPAPKMIYLNINKMRLEVSRGLSAQEV